MILKELRTRCGMTQKNVADFIGCSTVVYSRYETEDRMPSIDMLIKIADCFHVTIDYLVGRKADTVTGLSPYEAALINAARNADNRAREDALQLLKLHAQDEHA